MRLCLCLRKPGYVVTIIEFGNQVPLPDPVSFIDMQCLDTSAYLEGQVGFSCLDGTRQGNGIRVRRVLPGKAASL